MITYAELDENNEVVNLFAIDPEVFPTDEVVISRFTNKSLAEGHTIINATANNKAVFEAIYEAETHSFIPPKPEDHQSFVYNKETYEWEWPTPKPDTVPAEVTEAVSSEEELAKWGWDWNEELVAWEYLYHPSGEEGTSIDPGTKEKIEAIEASIRKVS